MVGRFHQEKWEMDFSAPISAPTTMKLKPFWNNTLIIIHIWRDIMSMFGLFDIRCDSWIYLRTEVAQNWAEVIYSIVAKLEKAKKW